MKVHSHWAWRLGVSMDVRILRVVAWTYKRNMEVTVVRVWLLERLRGDMFPKPLMLISLFNSHIWNLWLLIKLPSKLTFVGSGAPSNILRFMGRSYLPILILSPMLKWELILLFKLLVGSCIWILVASRPIRNTDIRIKILSVHIRYWNASM